MLKFKIVAYPLIEGMLVSKSEEVSRLLHSKEKLVSMVKSLQAALYSCEDQLRSSQSARTSMEEYLQTWLPHFNMYALALAQPSPKQLRIHTHFGPTRLSPPL